MFIKSAESCKSQMVVTQSNDKCKIAFKCWPKLKRNAVSLNIVQVCVLSEGQLSYFCGRN